MKRLVVLVLFLNAAYASEPLVVKYNSSGLVPPSWDQREACQVFPDKVVITRNHGADPNTGFRTVEERPITITGSLAGAIKKAGGDRLTETPNFVCDHPVTHIEARHETAQVVIFNTGGCGQTKKQREGDAAYMLKKLVDTYCPKTFE